VADNSRLVQMQQVKVLLQKTTAIQLSDFIKACFAVFPILLSLIFSRLAIVNPPKANKFAFLFK